MLGFKRLEVWRPNMFSKKFAARTRKSVLCQRIKSIRNQKSFEMLAFLQAPSSQFSEINLYVRGSRKEQKCAVFTSGAQACAATS